MDNIYTNIINRAMDNVCKNSNELEELKKKIRLLDNGTILIEGDNENNKLALEFLKLLPSDIRVMVKETSPELVVAKDVNLILKKNGRGYLSSYTVNIALNEAREIGFIDEDGQPKEIEKVVDSQNNQIILRVKAIND